MLACNGAVCKVVVEVGGKDIFVATRMYYQEQRTRKDDKFTHSLTTVSGYKGRMLSSALPL